MKNAFLKKQEDLFDLKKNIYKIFSLLFKKIITFEYKKCVKIM